MPNAVANAFYYTAQYFLGPTTPGIVYGAAYAGGYIAGSYGLSALSQDLIDKPDLPSSTGESMSQRLRMRKDPAQPHRVIYGRTKVGADLTYYEVNNGDKDLHMVCVFAGHPCEEIETIELNDDKLSLDANGNATGKYSEANVHVNKHLGDQTSADSELVNRVKTWKDTSVGYDKTYAYIRAEATDREVFSKLFNGMPTVRAIVKGKNDIFDPRDGTTGYTNNAALCNNDFITSDLYGYRLDQSEIDNEDLVDSANVCDETVDGEPRYTCNGTFRDNARKDGILRNMLASMAGETVWSRGSQRILAGAWRPPFDTFDKSNILSGIQQSTKRSRGELHNTIRGTFSDPEEGFNPTSFPQVQEPRFVDEDDGVVLPKSQEFPFITSEKQCQRVGRTMLRKHRQQKALTTTLDFSAFPTQAGDAIGLDMPRYVWNPKYFRIDKWQLKTDPQGEDEDPAPRITVNLSEIDQSVYADEAVSTTTTPNPVLTFE